MSRKTARVPRLSHAVRFLCVSRLLLWTIWVIYRERRRVIRAHEKGKDDVQPNIDVLIKVLVVFRQMYGPAPSDSREPPICRLA
jgi:hypothetical protein